MMSKLFFFFLFFFIDFWVFKEIHTRVRMSAFNILSVTSVASVVMVMNH